MIRVFPLSIPSNPKDPSIYLLFAVYMDNLCMKMAAVKRFWFDERKLIEMVNYILDTENSLPLPKFSEKLASILYAVVTAACMYFSGAAIAHFLGGAVYNGGSVNPTSNGDTICRLHFGEY